MKLQTILVSAAISIAAVAVANRLMPQVMFPGQNS